MIRNYRSATYLNLEIEKLEVPQEEYVLDKNVDIHDFHEYMTLLLKADPELDERVVGDQLQKFLKARKRAEDLRGQTQLERTPFYHIDRVDTHVHLRPNPKRPQPDNALDRDMKPPPRLFSAKSRLQKTFTDLKYMDTNKLPVDAKFVQLLGDLIHGLQY